METLGQYLYRVMRQKKLSPNDLALKCGITSSYIGRIIKGKGGNVSVETIAALAKGLDVDAHEVFTAAAGIPAKEGEAVDPLLIIDLLQQLLTDKRGVEVLREWLRLSAKNQAVLLDFISYLNEQQPKAKRSKSKPRRK